MVYVAVHIFHAAQSGAEPQAVNTIRHHFNEKGAGEVSDECDEDLQLEHGRMVALLESSVKKGKLGCDQGDSANFSRLCRSLFLGYLDSTMDHEPEIALRDLYPTFSEDQLAEAEANFRRYLAVLIAMAERLHREGRSILDDLESAGPDLTVSPTDPMIHDERSNNS